MKLELKWLKQVPGRPVPFDLIESASAANRKEEALSGGSLVFAKAVHLKGEASWQQKNGQIDLTMHIRTALEVACSRCLSPIALAIALDQQIVLREEPASGFGSLLVEEFSYPYGATEIDLMPYARGLIINSLEFKYLCRPDCKGLCPHCGHDLNAGPCGCPVEAPRDPRLAVLKKLLS